MRYAISIPQYVSDGSFDPGALRRYLTRAEELGFHSAWTGEQMLGTMPHLGPLELMAYAAACTDRIRLGCAALVSSLHGPVELAKSVSTLDQLSRGRVEVAITTGGRFRPFAAFGVDPDSFVSRFTEGLRLMKELWQNDRLDFGGRFWQLSNAAMEPKPYQKPHPPIWIAASAPPSLRRAVRLGDGFFGAGSSTTADFAGHVRIVREALTEQQRDPATFPIAKRIYIAVDDDASRARDRIAAALEDLYGYFGLRGLAAVAVAGTPDDCVKGAQEVIDAGAEMVLFGPMFDEAEQMERLAAEVIPRLHTPE
jgi:alkanesulfonate monooxygenase SsuD/methylene tetrahydromethanopterin reductase-like flavin-dependent oxidoreductase (luciferase family)